MSLCIRPAAAMHSHQAAGNGHGDALNFSQLSLNDSGSAAGAPAPVAMVGGRVGPGADLVSAANTNKPALNILNQASNVTQLNANNTSFDPSRALAPPVAAAAGVVEARQSPPQQSMVASYLVPSGSSSVASQPSTLAMPGQVPSQPVAVAPVVPQPVQTVQSAHLNLAQNAVPSAASTSIGAPAPAVVIPQQPVVHQTQQQTVLHQQPNYAYSDRKTLMNGRVPATRRDGRKLFVGGLPNEVSDLSFLQFFQQYGEVIDSVVLLDRRTKRSRGFGFVTFADPNVAASLLTTIPGRTGVVNIMGKNCEVKASEPKTAEAIYMAQSALNMPPQHHSPQWSNQSATPQRVVFGAGGNAAARPLQVNPTMPPNFNYVAAGGADSGVPIYSHSTITRTTAGPVVAADGTMTEGAANVYIQNNFYTLPPGSEIPSSVSVTPSPEALQAHQTELVQKGGASSLGQAVLIQPSYSTASGGEGGSVQQSYSTASGNEFTGQLQHHSLGHMTYTSGQH